LNRELSNGKIHVGNGIKENMKIRFIEYTAELDFK
jgi:hypothetical protein